MEIRLVWLDGGMAMILMAKRLCHRGESIGRIYCMIFMSLMASCTYLVQAQCNIVKVFKNLLCSLD
jgi:hypothetical protein